MAKTLTNNGTVPYMLSILEACQYFNIGENKLRGLIHSNPTANYILMNGPNKVMIKRALFEEFLDNASAI